MFATLVNAFKVKELRRKMLFTLLVLVLYRLGAVIPVPFVNSELLNTYFNTYAQGSLFQYFSILSGGAFSKATLFALSVSPYITASIVIQLLSIAIPALEKIAKDGDAGRKKLNRYTRYLTVVLALVTAYGYYLILKQLSTQMGTDVVNYFTNSHVFEAIVIIACYCAGAALIMWMGEKIDEYGIGNGISLILFVNIISRIPTLCGEVYGWGNAWWSKILFCVGAVVVLRGRGCRLRRSDRLHRPCDGVRAPLARAVCKEGCRQEDVRRPGNDPSDQAEHERRYADHLRFLHCVSACNHRKRLHAEGWFLLGRSCQLLLHGFLGVPDLLLRFHHSFCILLHGDFVQSR